MVCGSSAKCCPPAAPVSAFKATPSGASGDVCSLNAILATDDSDCGLDCPSAGAAALDGVSVTACVGVDFGGEFTLDPIIVRARTGHNACGTACVGADCDTGHSMHVFRGIAKGAYTYVATQQNMTNKNTDYAFNLGAPARFVVVCRSAWGPVRDDILVDSIRQAGCL